LVLRSCGGALSAPLEHQRGRSAGERARAPRSPPPRPRRHLRPTVFPRRATRSSTTRYASSTT